MAMVDEQLGTRWSDDMTRVIDALRTLREAVDRVECEVQMIDNQEERDEISELLWPACDYLFKIALNLREENTRED